jgi:hypothetical protein
MGVEEHRKLLVVMLHVEKWSHLFAHICLMVDWHPILNTIVLDYFLLKIIRYMEWKLCPKNSVGCGHFAKVLDDIIEIDALSDIH